MSRVDTQIETRMTPTILTTVMSTSDNRIQVMSTVLTVGSDSVQNALFLAIFKKRIFLLLPKN